MAQLRYFGISFFEIVTDDGKVVHLDPCLSREINTFCPITLDDIGQVDVVAVTHKARDHFRDAIPVVQKTGARLVSTHDVFYAGKREGIPEDRMQKMLTGMCIEVGGVRIRSLKTEHGSWTDTETGQSFEPSLSYMVYVREDVAIYHVGDTSIFGDMALFGTLYRPKVMLVPIGRSTATGAVVMDPREAAVATAMVSPEIVVPVHYDRVGQPEYPGLFARHLETVAPHVKVRMLNPGESMEV